MASEQFTDMLRSLTPQQRYSWRDRALTAEATVAQQQALIRFLVACFSDVEWYPNRLPPELRPVYDAAMKETPNG